jgi:tetratricopeptide (TPR) repeat protein
MKSGVAKVAVCIVAFAIVVLIGAGVWAYSNGYYHAVRGGIASKSDKDQAIALFKVAYEKNPQAFMVAHDIACCYAEKGDYESCFHWLRLALKTNHADYVKKYARTDQEFDSIRQTPEFRSLIDDSDAK